MLDRLTKHVDDLPLLFKWLRVRKLHGGTDNWSTMILANRNFFRKFESHNLCIIIKYFVIGFDYQEVVSVRENGHISDYCHLDFCCF